MEEPSMKDISLDYSRENIPILNSEESSNIIEWVSQIKDEKKREQALAELSKKRESFAELALYIWYSPGTVSCL
jgi:hypothetical protein